MPLDTGRILNNRYRIVSLLGQGGFGAVYRAWDLNLKRPCAVKENLETNPQSQQQFENEATVLANLFHQHLPRVTDHFVLPDQGQYLVMDFVEGQDLDDMITQRGPIPVKQAVEWITQIADALDYLHSQKRPVIHRDIKPANIRVTSDGKPYLVDFGLVKLYQTQVYTTPGARGVTPGFSPPEQYGHGGTDARTDVYALAATLYALVTGVTPPESVHRYGQVSQTPAHVANPEVPHSVSSVIERGMALDPDHRYQSAREFKAALNAALLKVVGADTKVASLSKETIMMPDAADTLVATPSKIQQAEAAVPQKSTRPGSAFTTNRLLIGGLIGLIVLLCGALLYTLGFLPFGPGEEEVDVESTRIRQTRVAIWVEETQTAQADELISEPEERTNTSTPPSETTDIVPPPDEPTISPTFSPSPAQDDTVTPTETKAVTQYDLAFASDRDGEFQIYLMDTQTGNTKALPRPPGYERVWWPSFCRDKVAVEAQDRDSGGQWIYLLDIESGFEQRLNAPNSPANLGVPRCSPGGDFLAYSANVGKEWFLYVTDFSTTYEIDPPDGLISGYSSWPAFGTDFLFQVITQEDRINLIYRMSGHPSGGQYAKIDSGANPSLSPDGSRMVYSCEMVGNDRTLCISNADGSNSQSLVTVVRIDVPGVGWNIQPASAWSGDGSWVYYASADDGDWDIYRIRPDGSDRQNLTDHLGSANEINPALKW